MLDEPHLLVLPERHVELAAIVETAQSVVAGSIQVVEEARRLTRVRLPFPQQRVEARAVRVEHARIVVERDVDVETALQPLVEIDQMGVDVVEQRAPRLQPERHRQAAAERLDQPPVRVRPATAARGAAPATACRRPISTEGSIPRMIMEFGRTIRYGHAFAIFFTDFTLT
jgi:hypothetical protein